MAGHWVAGEGPGRDKQKVGYCMTESSKKEDKTDFLMHNRKKKIERLQASLKRQYISLQKT
jgi:hypothetical protein